MESRVKVQEWLQSKWSESESDFIMTLAVSLSPWVECQSHSQYQNFIQFWDFWENPNTSAISSSSSSQSQVAVPYHPVQIPSTKTIVLENWTGWYGTSTWDWELEPDGITTQLKFPMPSISTIPPSLNPQYQVLVRSTIPTADNWWSQIPIPSLLGKYCGTWTSD